MHGEIYFFMPFVWHLVSQVILACSKPVYLSFKHRSIIDKWDPYLAITASLTLLAPNGAAMTTNIYCCKVSSVLDDFSSQFLAD